MTSRPSWELAGKSLGLPPDCCVENESINRVRNSTYDIFRCWPLAFTQPVTAWELSLRPSTRFHSEHMAERINSLSKWPAVCVYTYIICSKFTLTTWKCFVCVCNLSVTSFCGHCSQLAATSFLSELHSKAFLSTKTEQLVFAHVKHT